MQPATAAPGRWPFSPAHCPPVTQPRSTTSPHRANQATSIRGRELSYAELHTPKAFCRHMKQSRAIAWVKTSRMGTNMGTPRPKISSGSVGKLAEEAGSELGFSTFHHHPWGCADSCQQHQPNSDRTSVQVACAPHWQKRHQPSSQGLSSASFISNILSKAMILGFLHSVVIHSLCLRCSMVLLATGDSHCSGAQAPVTQGPAHQDGQVSHPPIHQKRRKVTHHSGKRTQPLQG